MKYLGMIVNSVEMSFALPTVNAQEVMMCKLALNNNQIILRNFAPILGNFTWAIPSKPFFQSHYRSIQHFYLIE